MWLQDEDDTASTAGGQRLHQYTPPEPRHQAATRCGKHAHAALPTGFRKSTAILRSWSLWSQKENDAIRMDEAEVTMGQALYALLAQASSVPVDGRSATLIAKAVA